MYTYIVIDDEELIRLGTVKKLSAVTSVTCIGFAENGKEALELIREKKPDFVITDMQMPVMNGMELLPYLTKHFPDLPLLVISGYKNFDYVKQAMTSGAVEYLLKPFDRTSIQRCVQQIVDRLNNNLEVQSKIELTARETEKTRLELDKQMLYHLIMGHSVSDAILVSDKCQRAIDNRTLILLALYSSSPLSEKKLADQLIEEHLEEITIIIPDPENPHCHFIILCLPQSRRATYASVARQMIALISQHMYEAGETLYAGVSYPREEITGLSSALTECAMALDSHKINTTKETMCYFPEEHRIHMITWDKKEEFLFRIETGTADEVKELTNMLFQYICAKEGLTVGDLKQSLFAIQEDCVILLNQYMHSENIHEHSASTQRIMAYLFDIEDIRQYFLQFFLNINAMISPCNVYSMQGTIEQICLYLKRNYYKNISQELVASLFYMNRSYLSTLFKKSTGQKFVDYLNDIRIEKACHLLGTSNRKLFHIAKMVGYDNVKYFFRIFKKRKGVSPEQYRKNALESHL